MRRLFGLLLVLLVPAAAAAQPLTVVRVLDSTTFLLSNGQLVQLIGLAPPEQFFPSARRTVALTPAERAMRYAAALTMGRPVTAAPDPGDPQARLDGRPSPLPVYLSVVNEEGTFRYNVGEVMLYEGYALVDTQRPFQYLSRYLGLQQRAAEEERGLWSTAPPAALPPSFREPTLEGRIEPPAANSEGIDLLSGCTGHPDCVWITGPDATLGAWHSRRPGSCPCAPR